MKKLACHRLGTRPLETKLKMRPDKQILHFDLSQKAEKRCQTTVNSPIESAARRARGGKGNRLHVVGPTAPCSLATPGRTADADFDLGRRFPQLPVPTRIPPTGRQTALHASPSTPDRRAPRATPTTRSRDRTTHKQRSLRLHIDAEGRFLAKSVVKIARHPPHVNAVRWISFTASFFTRPMLPPIVAFQTISHTSTCHPIHLRTLNK